MLRVQEVYSWTFHLLSYRVVYFERLNIQTNNGQDSIGQYNSDPQPLSQTAWKTNHILRGHEPQMVKAWPLTSTFPNLSP